jgi:hypothetical protein
MTDGMGGAGGVSSHCCRCPAPVGLGWGGDSQTDQEYGWDWGGVGPSIGTVLLYRNEGGKGGGASSKWGGGEGGVRIFNF